MKKGTVVKLLRDIETSSITSGDRITFEEGLTGTIIEIDEKDYSLPYQVSFDNEATWVGEDEIEEISE